MCRCFARQLHPFYYIAYVLYQSFVLLPSPGGRAGDSGENVSHSLKNNIASHRAAEQGKCLILTFMHQSFVTTPKPRGKAVTLTFSPAKPCQKQALRRQSVGKSPAISSAVSCFHYTAFLAHLNQRLIGELIVYPCSVVVRPSLSFTMLKHLKNHLADQSQILCGASLGRGNEIWFAVCWSHD